MSSLKGCPVCLKWVVLLFNLLFWFAGVGILVLAIYLRIDFARYVRDNPYVENYLIGTYVLMAAGSTITIIGFFGCCGAYKESPCMLGTFFALLFVIFAAEVSAGVWAFMRQDTLQSTIDRALQYKIENYGVDPVQTEALDVIQREVMCCGIIGPQDWRDSKYGTTLDVGVAGKAGYYRVPKSCCSAAEDSIRCSEEARTVAILSPVLHTIHAEGCRKAFHNHMNEFLNVIAGIGIGIAVIELFGMILSIVLCCAIRREEEYLYKH